MKTKFTIWWIAACVALSAFLLRLALIIVVVIAMLALAAIFGEIPPQNFYQLFFYGVMAALVLYIVAHAMDPGVFHRVFP